MTDLEKWLAENKRLAKYQSKAESKSALAKALRMLEGTVGELSKWLKHIKNYDPYGPKGVDRYGSGTAGIERTGVEEKLKEILNRIDQIAKE